MTLDGAPLAPADGSFDPRGRLVGSVPIADEYAVTLTATTDKGTASKRAARDRDRSRSLRRSAS